MLQEFGIALQGWGDCFVEFEESNGSIKEGLQLLAIHKVTQLGSVRRGQDEHIAELSMYESAGRTLELKSDLRMSGAKDIGDYDSLRHIVKNRGTSECGFNAFFC